MSEPVFDARGVAAGQCPACQRPIAMPGVRCLYCGAALPEALLATRAKDVPALTKRLLVIIDATADAGALASALGRPLAEANTLKRRSKHLLHCILPEAEAEEERRRLANLGVSAVTLREAAVRAASRPRCATGGVPAEGVFSVGADGETCRIAAGDVLLLVVGPIRREPQSVETHSLRGLRRVPWSHVTDTECYHVHCRRLARPIEIDPETFVFARASARIESTWRRLRAELSLLAGAAEIDDDFRRETPALGLSARAPLSPFGEPQSAKGRGAPPTYLDNLPQFRYYSAWRGALAQQRAGLPPIAEPPL
jgi:hypothetical protein